MPINDSTAAATRCRAATRVASLSCFWCCCLLLGCLCRPTVANRQITQLGSVISVFRQHERDCLNNMVPGLFKAVTDLANAKAHSNNNNNNSLISSASLPAPLSCPSTFDGLICWPSIPAGASLSLPCPTSVFQGGSASRRCRQDGSWDHREEEPMTSSPPGDSRYREIVVVSTYTNYSQCPRGSQYDGVASWMRTTHVSESSQQIRLGLERLLCHHRTRIARAAAAAATAHARRPSCPPVFDNILCWSGAPGGSRVFASCPSYLNALDRRGRAWRTCLPNGTWLWPQELQGKSGAARAEGWTNFSECHDQSATSADSQVPLGVINAIHTMGHVGYGISLACLLLAILILAAFRRLHCQRNGIHINMYFVFFFRSLSHFVTYFVLKQDQTILCRINQGLMTYTVLSSFTWVSVEALHLYMLIFVNTMSAAKMSTGSYMAIGWGAPCIITGIWVILRVALDNSECWLSYKPMGADIWLLNLYLCLLVFINAGLFIRIVRELFVKLKSQPRTTAVSQNYRKLWKSTSVLVIVFGIYYIIFLPMSIIPKDRLGASLDYMKLFYEHFFNSFQGVFVSLLFCFTNSEVHKELKRLLLDTRLGQWLKTRGLIRPLVDVYGLEPENRGRSNRRARRATACNLTESLPLRIGPGSSS